MTDDVNLNRGWDDIASNTTAILLAVGLIATAGIAVAVAGGGEPVEATSATADESQTDDPDPEADEIAWPGHLAIDACAPSGPNACHGASLGDAEDRYDTRIAQDAASVELEMTWEADTPDTEELELSLASGHAEQCGRATCFYWTTQAQAVGTSPLTLEAYDITVDEGETLWLAVDTPDPTPEPLHSDVHTFQHFEVTGEIVPASEDATTDGAE